MELDKIREMWKTQLGQDIFNNKNSSEEIREIIMNSKDILTELDKTNKYWWKAIKTTIIHLLGIGVINFILFLNFPEKFGHISDPVSFYLSVFLFALVSLGLFYFQHNIFDIDRSSDLKSVIEQAVKQFQKFYLLENIFYLVMFPFLFYFATKVVLQLFRINIDSYLIMVSAGSLTLLCILINYIYYKRKYFGKIALLKKNLKELTQE